MADTAALVVALSAQLTKFEKDMRAAGIMAEKAVGDIEDKFSKMSPKISTSFFGNLFAGLADKAIAGVGDAIKDLVTRFDELQKASKYTELSMQWLYGLQQAGAKAGSTFGEINAAVKSLAFQLDEMKRGGDNALKTLLDANPQFMKGVNRDSMDAAQTLRIVADIIANAKNNIQAVDIAKNLGLPENTVALLQKGGAAIEQMAQAAAKGAPDLQALADKSKALATVWDNFLASLKSGALENAFAVLQKLAAVAVAIGEVEIKLFKGGPLEATAERELAKWKSVEAILNRTAEKAEKADVSPKRIPITGGTAVDPFARKAAVDDTTTALERQTDQIEKHILVLEADAAAAGKTVGEQERLKTEALLTAAAERDGVQATGEYAEALRLLAQRAGEARLAQARAADQIAKMNQASQIVGSALSTAFADAIVEGKKLNEVLDALIKTLLKAAINASIMSLFAPGAGGGFAPVLSLLGIGGARMAGGPVGAGQSYLVGEDGPELFRPNQGGMVIPNQALGRGSAGGATVQNTFMVAGDVSPATIARLQAAVVAANQKADGLAKVMGSTQRLQASGVS